jgi:hypothetical protein
MLEIGQKVRVARIRDRIPQDLVGKIKQSPVGVITGFRMVDGSGVGIVVKFSDSFSTWFFEDEVQPA